MDRSVKQAAFVLAASVATAVGVSVIDPALACFPSWTCSAPQPGPAPLIGVGLPIAGVVFAGLLVARRLRRKD